MNKTIFHIILLILIANFCSSQNYESNNLYNSCTKIKWDLDKSNKADSLFAISFEKMKNCYSKLFLRENFMTDFEDILKINPNHVPTLMNIFYYTFRYRAGDYIYISHEHLEKLINIDKENSLFATFKFAEYEKLIWLAFLDKEYEDYPIVQEAIDSLSYLANFLYNKYQYLKIQH